MPCDHRELDLGGGKKASVHICSRGRRKACACGRPATKLCDFPLRGGRKGAPLCDAHAHAVGPNRDLCRAHAAMAHASGVSVDLLADEHKGALDVAADQVEQAGYLVTARPCTAAFCRKAARRRCSFPLPGGRVCGRELCEDHIERHGPELDLCPQHAHAPAPRAAEPAPPPRPPGQPHPKSRCRDGDGAVALRELERQLAKDEVASFAGVYTRSRSDCLDAEAIDFVLARDETFAPRDLADWQEYCAERAAIFEFLGGRPRQVAEAMARQLAGPAPRGARHGPLFAGAR